MEKLKRLRFNEEALENSLLRLKEAEQHHKDTEVYQSVAEALLWIETTKEWHLSLNNYSYRKIIEKRPIIKSTKLPYNLVKHNMDFIKFHQIKGGVTFPFTFPMIINVIEATWIDVDDNLHEKHEKVYISQVTAYKKYLEGKNIYNTMNTISELLLKLGENINEVSSNKKTSK